MAQHQPAIFFEMSAEAQEPLPRPDHLLEHGLALDQRQRAQIIAVEKQQIERVEDEAIHPPFAEIGLQSGEIGSASAVFDHQLAVDQPRTEGERLERRDHVLAELLRPIVAAAGEEFHPAGLDARLQAIAIELDLVQPALALRRRGHERRQCGFDEIGECGFPGALDAGGIRKRGFGLGLYG